MYGMMHFYTNMADFVNYSKEYIVVFTDLYDAVECLWKVKCQDYSDRTNKAVPYETLIQKLQEVNPEANHESDVKKVTI
jgi:hypothetical protein